MKKFFTLIAAVAMAASVNAQTESYTFSKTSDIKSAGNQTFATENVTMVNGVDVESGGWSAKIPNAEKGEIAPAGYDAYIVAKNNPKNGDTPGSGSGYSVGDITKLPKSGGYYTFVCKSAGDLEVGVKLGYNKNFYVVDGETAAVIEDLNIKDAVTGNAVTLTDESKLPSSFEKAGNLYGTVTFKAVANKTYYVFAVGSKLSLYGYKFTKETSTGISNVNSTSSAKSGKTYNLAGQEVSGSYKGLVIKNGKKYVK